MAFSRGRVTGDGSCPSVLHGTSPARAWALLPPHAPSRKPRKRPETSVCAPLSLVSVTVNARSAARACPDARPAASAQWGRRTDEQFTIVEKRIGILFCQCRCRPTESDVEGSPIGQGESSTEGDGSLDGRGHLQRYFLTDPLFRGPATESPVHPLRPSTGQVLSDTVLFTPSIPRQLLMSRIGADCLRGSHQLHIFGRWRSSRRRQRDAVCLAFVKGRRTTASELQIAGRCRRQAQSVVHRRPVAPAGSGRCAWSKVRWQVRGPDWSRR